MYEIELKARVRDKEALEEKLKKNAIYRGFKEKKDTYWKLTKNGGFISCRIREENSETKEGKASEIFFTYKRKEIRATENGATIELNDEKECSISGKEALEVFLQDTGFKIELYKTKKVSRWEYGEALLELCLVEPLGYFLEIEILSPVNDPETVENKKKQLLEILKTCGIPETEIENRYYRELILEQNISREK